MRLSISLRVPNYYNFYFFFLQVCVPVVVVFAPLGSFLASHFHRQVLASLVYILDTVAIITALMVILVTTDLAIMCGGLLVGGFIGFYGLSLIHI